MKIEESEPEPLLLKIVVTKVVEVTRLEGTSTVVEYFDLDGLLLFTLFKN